LTSTIFPSESNRSVTGGKLAKTIPPSKGEFPGCN
jgi:hypothetical protein